MFRSWINTYGVSENLRPLLEVSGVLSQVRIGFGWSGILTFRKRGTKIRLSGLSKNENLKIRLFGWAFEEQKPKIKIYKFGWASEERKPKDKDLFWYASEEQKPKIMIRFGNQDSFDVSDGLLKNRKKQRFFHAILRLISTSTFLPNFSSTLLFNSFFSSSLSSSSSPSSPLSLSNSSFIAFLLCSTTPSFPFPHYN
ncbi:hypothetical protein RIR_jg14860.t1 [Rhizophagus irregularis DAOM 181602=DAOM 197198]|nr:hypothetical protein RIR_jg14860.t1 [Rhizophagus irregularis DAOM 181602=DAOM 197198]